MNTLQPVERLLGFIHYLRDEGYTVGISEITDILAGLDNGKLANRRHARNVIRALACQDADDWQRFNELFMDYWYVPEETIDTSQPDNPAMRGHDRGSITGIGGSTEQLPEQLGGLTGLKGSGAGRQKTISKADFRFLNDRKAMLEVEQLAEQLAEQLNRRLRRKTRIRQSGVRLAIRQTIRRNLAHGGFPVKPCFRDRRREPLHIVILHDVSQSMAWNNPLLFRFARGIARAFRNSDIYAFHTQLFRVTEFYREQSLTVMKQRLEDRNHLWMGGTCIAESLGKFNYYHAARALTRHTVFIMISDGFDTNEPEYLARELARVRKAVKKIIWLNPMLGREGYEPDRNSMRAAMPFIDRHAPAHSLDALKSTMNYIAGECRGVG